MTAHLGLAVTAFVDGELSHDRREEVLAHLLHCEPCRAEVGDVRRFKSAVRAAEPSVPFDLTARLMAATAELPPLTSARPDGAVLSARRVATLTHSLTHRRPVKRSAARRTVTAGAVVLVGLGGALSLAGPPPRGPVAPVDPTSNSFMIDHATTTSEVPFTEPGVVSVSSSTAP